MKTETRRQVAERIATQFYETHGGVPSPVVEAIEAALNAERERCAKIADQWANAKSCTIHDDNPCCHVRTGAAIAEKIRGNNH